jgi:hypothetical protein
MNVGRKPPRAEEGELEQAASVPPTHGVPEQIGEQRATYGGEQRRSEAQLPESGQRPDSEEEGAGRNRNTSLNGEDPRG